MVLLSLVIAPLLVTSVAGLLGDLPWPIVGGGGAALAVGALVLHRWRFAGRRARDSALVPGLGLRCRVRRATRLALSEGDLRLTVVLDTCDPLWALEVVELNAETCDADLDRGALEAHASELRSAGLR
ncbi:MAG: hypothetical protein KF878_04525 [Planctomycetes bacterium]|nr:hypothetical protein [Planctomycetota bacterium]